MSKFRPGTVAKNSDSCRRIYLMIFNCSRLKFNLTCVWFQCEVKTHLASCFTRIANVLDLNLSLFISNAGYIVLRVLLHFSETKKGSKFGLKQNGTKSERLRDEKNGIHDVKKTDWIHVKSIVHRYFLCYLIIEVYRMCKKTELWNLNYLQPIVFI